MTFKKKDQDWSKQKNKKKMFGKTLDSFNFKKKPQFFFLYLKDCSI